MAEPDSTVMDYVKAHRLALLATQRKSGPPQMTMINYMFDGENYLISVRGFSQKAKNLMKRPEATLAIVDGRQQVIVYGKTRVITDFEEVMAMMLDMRRHAGMPDQDAKEMRESAQREERIVVVFTPTSYYPTTMPQAPVPAATPAR